MAMVMMMAMVTAMAMVTVMSKTVAMMAVRNGGDALGYGDDDGNDAMAVRLMTAMMAMTLWKRTVRDGFHTCTRACMEQAVATPPNATNLQHLARHLP